ncbi:MAG: type II toxin-antitoxin system VapC family toxin [Chloroflexota bacterium]
MGIYLDTSGLAKRYVREPGSELVLQLMVEDPDWVTGRHTWVETSLVLARTLDGDALTAAQDAFEDDWNHMVIVNLDDTVCREAARIGQVARLRSLDALHLACAERAGRRDVPIITFDVRLADAARSLGFTVLGV